MKISGSIGVLLVSMVGWVLPAGAQDPEPPALAPAADPAAAGKDSILENFGFGFGLGVLHLDEPEVTEVSLEKGIVRVTGEEQTKNGFWLQSHYLFATSKLKKDGKTPRIVFHGLFAGVQITEGSDFLKTVGVGYMVALKRKRGDDADRSSFNLGLGLCNTQVSRLATGIRDNEPLPSDYEQIRLRKENALAPMLVLSFSLQ